MSILRVIGACFWVGCGWLGGDFFCVRTQEHLDDLDKTIRLLHRLQQEISCRRTELNALYQDLFREDMLFRDSQSDGCFRTLNAPSSFQKQEADCFYDCFSHLGRAEASQECDRIRFCIQRFEEFREEAEQASKTQLALSRKLGLGAGLAAAILFL